MTDMRDRDRLLERPKTRPPMQRIRLDKPAPPRIFRWLGWMTALVVAAAAVTAGVIWLTDGGDEESALQPAPVTFVQPDPASVEGYWNSYLSEWVPFERPPEGYWNSYLSEWVPFDQSSPVVYVQPDLASVEGYWNSYLNEWVPFERPPEGYWNSYLNEWVPFERSADGYWNSYLNEWVPFTP